MDKVRLDTVRTITSAIDQGEGLLDMIIKLKTAGEVVKITDLLSWPEWQYRRERSSA